MSDFDLFLQNFLSTDWKMYMTYFWEQVTIETFLKLIVIYFIVVWMSLIIWVYKDVTSKSQSVLFQIFCIFLVILFAPLGIFIYLLVRPSTNLYEKFYEEVEENLDILSDTIKNSISECHNCGANVSVHYSFCPHCEVELHESCKGCGKMISPDFKICPYCGKRNKKKKEE